MFASYVAGEHVVDANVYQPFNNQPSMVYPPKASFATTSDSQNRSPSSRRSSRGSMSHRPAGAVRVTKPQSASNSPRSALLQSRRRTMITSGLSPFGTRMHDLAHFPAQAAEDGIGLGETPSRRAMRPVSWHPSSFQASQPYYWQGPPLGQYPFPSAIDTSTYHYGAVSSFPQTPLVYSGYASPSSAFSPLSLPYSGIEGLPFWADPPSLEQAMPQCIPSEQQDITQEQYKPSNPTFQFAASAQPSSLFTQPYLQYSSSPPTPNDVPTARQASEVKMPTEEAIPFQPLEEDDSEGEILYGMGLYDPPDTPERSDMDNSYATPMSTLLGSRGRTGKGLKLEDAWTPPSPSAYQDEDGEDDTEDVDEQ